jgi:hypothetical protein
VKDATGSIPVPTTKGHVVQEVDDKAYNILLGAITLYRDAEGQRYQGRFLEAQELIKDSIKLANSGMDMTKDKVLCRDFVSFLSAAVAMSDGLRANQR